MYGVLRVAGLCTREFRTICNCQQQISSKLSQHTFFFRLPQTCLLGDPYTREKVLAYHWGPDHVFLGDQSFTNGWAAETIFTHDTVKYEQVRHKQTSALAVKKEANCHRTTRTPYSVPSFVHTAEIVGRSVIDSAR